MNFRQLAWDGVALTVPEKWELAAYRFLPHGITHIEIEDDCAVRLEAEWIRPARPRERSRFLARCEERLAESGRVATASQRLDGLPEGWSAVLHTFRETVPVRRKDRGLSVVEHCQVNAFFADEAQPFLGSFVMHFMPADREAPEETARQMIRGFRRHDAPGLVPWELFDLRVELPHDFRIVETHFDIGAKQMGFEWQGRSFRIWFFSCADEFLRDGIPPEQWVCGYLNSYGGYKAVMFLPSADGRSIVWQRRRMHPFGHRSELFRRCFRYEVRCRRDLEKNQLVAWVFHHRRPEDLAVLPEVVRGGRL